jgi:hypothetical protein
MKKSKITSNGLARVASTSTSTARLGDIIVALFDEASRLTTDSKRATRLATSALARILATARAQRAAQLLTSGM